MKDVVYQVYKVTNLLNDKFYIGVHKNSKERDGYLGSGKLLKPSIRKHGRENFRKDILFEFNTSTEAYAKESELVNRSLVESPMSYNVTLGGRGGWHNDGNRVGKVIVQNTEGIRFLVDKTDSRYLSGELVAWNKNKPKSKESNLLRSTSLAGKTYPKILCSHCGKRIDSRPHLIKLHLRGGSYITPIQG